MEPTKLKDLKPQLLCVGKILGMDLYIDMRGITDERKYDLAYKLLQELATKSSK